MYKVSLTTEQITFIYNLLVKEYESLYVQDKNHPDVETIEFCIWALEAGEGTYTSTFEDLLEKMEEEDAELE